MLCNLHHYLIQKRNPEPIKQLLPSPISIPQPLAIINLLSVSMDTGWHLMRPIVPQISCRWMFSGKWCLALCDSVDCSLPGFSVCPPPSPAVCSHSCPLGQLCHLTSSPSVTPFSSCLQSFPMSGSFPMSRPFPSGSQSIRASASASVLPTM